MKKMSQVCNALGFLFCLRIGTGSPRYSVDYQGPAAANLSMTSKK